MAESNRTHHTTSEPTQAGLSQAERAAQACAPTASARRRWQVIDLLATGLPLAEIVAATGFQRRTIRDIARRYREVGAAALADKRTHSQGAPRLLTPAQEAALWRVLQAPPPNGGTWTGPLVAEWLAATIGKRVHRQRGWEYLRRFARGEGQGTAD